MTPFSKLRIAAALFTAGIAFFASVFSAMAQDEIGPNRGISGQIFLAEPSSALQFGLLRFHPQSSIERREDIGYNAHTHFSFMIPPSGTVHPVAHSESTANFQDLLENPNKSAATSGPDLVINTPSSIACIYRLVSEPANIAGNCNPAYTTINPVGGGGAIAIIDAYNDPTAASDLAYFSKYFDLAPANFQIVYAGGKMPYISGPKPPGNSGWNIEEALDVEWAHAMAPGAKIYLVEAQSSSLSDLFTAVVAGEYLVSESGGGEVSMSWGSSEFSQETAYDKYFAPTSDLLSHVVLVASSGDVGSVVSYPASSPYVISVGGTTINRTSSGNFSSETAWSSSGGGVSCCETRPSYQSTKAIEAIAGSHRSTPDISLNANPSSGVAVYAVGEWYIVGGTSVSAPSIAGILNVVGRGAKDYPAASAEIADIYANGANLTDFRDIGSGSCGSHSALSGYDLCTGWGSPVTYMGK